MANGIGTQGDLLVLLGAASEMACARPTRKHPGGRTGTDAGYQAHAKAQEPPCASCEEGRRVAAAIRKPRKVKPPACTRPNGRYPNGRTGTYAGYTAHVKAREAACGPCEVANGGRESKLAEDAAAPTVCARRTESYPHGRTGTYAGYQAHATANEPSCEPCKDASRRRSVEISAAPDARERRQAEYRRNLDTYAARNLWNKHRMTGEQYDAMLARQGGGCAICGTDQPGGRGGRRFHVDHDHACCPGNSSCPKCWRGLLCANCNVGLGAFGDSTDRLIDAANYLENWKRRSDAETATQAGDAAA